MRILTRGDMDGLTSSLLLTLVEEIREIRFAHPKDVQDGLVEATSDDIVVNLPHVPGCGMWFDHHISEDRKLEDIGEFKGSFKVAPSCARVIHDHFASPKFAPFSEMLEATDRVDAAQLTAEEVANPEGWILLAYTLDPRTGLGPEFRKYFRWLAEYCKEVPLDKVLAHPEVKKRCDQVKAEQAQFLEVIKQYSREENGVIITDLREANMVTLPVGNRFLIYTLFPEAHVELRILNGHAGRTVLAIGHSIFNRTCKVNVGTLCGAHGGGGHRGAGTVQLDAEGAEAKLAEILTTLQTNQG